MIRFRHAERNYAAANQPKMFWEITGGHTDILQTGQARYLEGLDKYLRTYFKESISN
jgi:hypothetical protein